MAEKRNRTLTDMARRMTSTCHLQYSGEALKTGAYIFLIEFLLSYFLKLFFEMWTRRKEFKSFLVWDYLVKINAHPQILKTDSKSEVVNLLDILKNITLQILLSFSWHYNDQII